MTAADAVVRGLPEGAGGGAPAHFQVRAMVAHTRFQAHMSFDPVASNSPVAAGTASTAGAF